MVYKRNKIMIMIPAEDDWKSVKDIVFYSCIVTKPDSNMIYLKLIQLYLICSAIYNVDYGK